VLGDEVRKCRHELKLTQEAAAEDCDVHLNSLKLLEHGLRKSQVITLLKIAVGLQLPLSELFARVEKQPEYLRAIVQSKNKSTL
jgi:transcriptional regulator with XRE-family HTH domain